MSTEKHEFKTEVKQMLDIVINSLYTNKEIFFRELISNASDSIDKARYEALTNKDILEGKEDEEWKIKIIPDKEGKTITFRDNGIGMSKEQTVEELGTIARSGTREFLNLLQNKDKTEDISLIGQFGVGFYSAFMVADRVIVITKKAGEQAVKWESTADGTFTVEDTERDGRGTDVILHIKDDEKDYYSEWEIKNIVRKYSDYIEHPVVIDVEKEKDDETDNTKKIKVKEEEVLNSRKALWLKKKSDISKEEYEEFFKHITYDYTPPAKVIHYKAEGTSEFTALLYIPGRVPFDIFYKDYKIGPTLYIKRVQIMDHCEQLLPLYLRFVKGVVDSSDLPLNISRETLQNNREVELIKKNITKKVLDTLSDMKKNEYEEYLKFYKNFGTIIKEGLHYDYSKREDICDLLLYHSTKTEGDKFRTLQEYVDGMKEDQKEIYYISSGSIDEALHSPYLEVFKEKDYEVLIMTDEVDEFVVNGLDYKEKKFKSILKGDIELDKGEKEAKEKAKEKFDKLIDLMKDHLKEEVKDVRLSGRLKDSPCCIVADEGGMDSHMEKILKSMGQDVPSAKRILEINGEHSVFETMNKIFKEDSSSSVLKEYIDLVYNQALLLEGSKLKDPVFFAKLVSKLMVENIK